MNVIMGLPEFIIGIVCIFLLNIVSVVLTYVVAFKKGRASLLPETPKSKKVKTPEKEKNKKRKGKSAVHNDLPFRLPNGSIICSNCKGVILPLYKGNPRKKLYGSPLRICRHCHSKYFDDNYVELGLMDKLPRAKSFLRRFMLSMLLGCGIQAVIVCAILAAAPGNALSDLSSQQSSLFIFSPLFFGIVGAGLTQGKAKRFDENIDKELKSSHDRLGDPLYIAELRTYGVDISEEKEYNLTHGVY